MGIDDKILPAIDRNQFGALKGTGTTDALIEMQHNWYAASDRPGSVVRVLFVDYSKAFYLINHTILMEKLREFEIPASLIRWMVSFLLDRTKPSRLETYYLRRGTLMVAYLKGHYLAQRIF